MREWKKGDLDTDRNDVALLNNVNRKAGMTIDVRTRWRLFKERVLLNTSTKYKTKRFILSRAYINNSITSNELFTAINWLSTFLFVPVLNVDDNVEVEGDINDDNNVEVEGDINDDDNVEVEGDINDDDNVEIEGDINDDDNVEIEGDINDVCHVDERKKHW